MRGAPVPVPVPSRSSERRHRALAASFRLDGSGSLLETRSQLQAVEISVFSFKLQNAD